MRIIGKDTRIRVTSCEASSHYDNNSVCRNAFDRTTREWATRGEGAGSWIKAQFDGTKTVAAFTYRQRASSADWNRVIRLEFSDGFKQTYELKQDRGVQLFTLSKPVTTTFVKIVVESHYSKLNNGAVEIQFLSSVPSTDDKCKEDLHDCSPHATCTNNGKGLFTCACKAGYLGNGKQCFAEYILGSIGASSSCPAGFKKVDKTNCAVGARYAGVQAGANNQNGGYAEVSTHNAPVGCFIKEAALTTSNAWSPHWNVRTNAQNDGTYRVVCVRAGRRWFGLVWFGLG